MTPSFEDLEQVGDSMPNLSGQKEVHIAKQLISEEGGYISYHIYCHASRII